MRSNALVKVVGFPALLVHGDPLVLDRWLWLRRRLPRATGATPPALVDVGCGNGSFTIGTARRGYSSLGLTWNEEDATLARERAAIAKAPLARFEVQDVRSLDTRDDLVAVHDVVISFENLEHIIDDDRLMRAMAATLKPGGTMLLTTPNVDYRPLEPADAGPWLPIEDGRHVRKGYDEARLRELAAASGLEVTEISSCSGLLSQKVAGMQRFLEQKVHPLAGWLAIAPLRLFPPLLDPILRRLTRWPDYSICMVARRTQP